MKRLYRILRVTVLLSLLMPWVAISAESQNLVDIELNLGEDESLMRIIGAKADEIRKLTLSGYLTAEDIRFLVSKDGLINMEELDISKASIWELDGADYYCYYNRYYYVKNNTIGYLMFVNLPDKLEKIILPDNVVEIEDGAFDHDLQLEFSNNPNFVVEGGLLYDKNKTRLIFATDQADAYVIPETVTSISSLSFQATAIKQVDIPSSVTYVGEKAFADCTGLSVVKFTDRGNKAEGLKIAGGAFMKCDLSELQLPDNTSEVGDSAFYENSIEELVLPEGIKCIGDSAFLGYSATRQFVPSSVESIGVNAFYSETLNSIEVDADNEYYSSHNGALFNKDKTILLSFPGGKTGSYSVPNGVNRIEKYAFYRSVCDEVELPSSTNVIGEYAFEYSKTPLVNLSGVERIGKYAFYRSGIKSANIPLVEELYAYTFYSCRNLEYLNISGAFRAGEQAVNWLTGLKTLEVGEMKIGGDFHLCPLLREVYCYAERPPVGVSFKRGIGEGEKTKVYLATLYVPKGSYVYYWGSSEWGNFGEIIEMGDGSVEEIGGDGIAVRTVDGRIVVEGCGDGVLAEVYDLSGRLAYAGEAAAIPELSAGIYVVRIAGVAYKVAVR